MLPDGLVTALLHDGGSDSLVGAGYTLLCDDASHTMEETLKLRVG